MQGLFHKLIDEASKVVLDKRGEIKLSVVCLLANGHLLIEDMPGVGKTTLVNVLGKLLGLQTRRIQFTIDLLPADILGGQIFSQQDQKFIFFPGPVFSQVLMADELNRTSPRSQSALLQAMEEGVVTVDGVTYKLPEPFFVIATQNPQQQAGTFPLPESQLDRFLISLELLYASKETESEIFRSREPRELIQGLTALLDEEKVRAAIKEASQVQVSQSIADYVAQILENSRVSKIEGAQPLSTRAGMALIRAAKAWAYLEERSFVRHEDIQSLVVPVFGHRLGGAYGIKKGREWAQQLLQNTPLQISKN